jgi:hypothetical protein
MADVRPVKPGIYSKIVGAQSIKERDGFYIDSPYFAQKRAEAAVSFMQLIAENVKETYEKYFLTPGSQNQMESFRVLVSQYAQCPLDWVKVIRGENGFDVSISPDVPMEDLSMEVTCET